jgi:hypothetical protein
MREETAPLKMATNFPKDAFQVTLNMSCGPLSTRRALRQSSLQFPLPV